jgi:hypothetical protein
LDLQLWLQLLGVSPTAVVLVAWFKGLFISRWQYDVTIATYQARIDDETERANKAEAERDRAMNLVFEALGANQAMIQKLRGSGPVPSLPQPTT